MKPGRKKKVYQGSNDRFKNITDAQAKSIMEELLEDAGYDFVRTYKSIYKVVSKSRSSYVRRKTTYALFDNLENHKSAKGFLLYYLPAMSNVDPDWISRSLISTLGIGYEEYREVLNEADALIKELNG